MAEENVLLQLLNARSKAELVTMCKEVTLSRSDLVEVILAAKVPYFPLCHMAIFRDHLSEDLQFKERDFAGMADLKPGDPVGKIGTKLTQIFKQRRRTMAHAFWLPDTPTWAIISFDVLDVTDRENHWKGPHVHMLSDLTHPQQGAFRRFLEKLEQDTPPNLPHPLHIRFERG